MSDKQISQIQRDEHSTIGGRSGKKIHLFPNIYYQQASLVSGYIYHGLAVPGSNPTQSLFRLMRETLDTSEFLFADGSSKYSHQWSSSSLASVNYL